MADDTEQNSAARGLESEWLLSESTRVASATNLPEQLPAISTCTSTTDATMPGDCPTLYGINDIATQNRKYAGADSVATTTILAQETKRLVRNSIPIILAYILQYSSTFINIYVLGHIGPNELAASGLVNMTTFVVAYSPSIGLAVALETFCSTAFTASQDKTLVGFHLQRGIIAVTAYFLCISPALWYLETILLWLNQDPHIAMLCGSFMRVNMAGLLPWMYYECVKCFLQGQEIMYASTNILLVITPIQVIASYLFVWSPSLGFGFLGAAAASVLTSWLMLTAIVPYVRCSAARHAWGGWTIQAFKTMPQYFQLAFPSMIMLCAEWWILDLVVLASSYLGSTTLAAQGIIINTCGFAYQFSDGVSVAVCNRVGNLLGQARVRRARLTVWLGISAGVYIGVATIVIAAFVGSWWGRIYSNDKEIVALVAVLIPACAIFQMLDAVNSVASGVLRSLGRQYVGALINFVAYYLVGFPIALYLTYGRPHAGAFGLWYGIGAGVGLTVLMQLLIFARTNWRNEVQNCMVRVSEDSLAFANNCIEDEVED